jgi:hypothetical protein
MPDLETFDLHDKITLWPSVGVDAYGQPTVADIPLSKIVRWINTRRIIRRQDGTSLQLDASAVVAEDINEGSIIWPNPIETLPAGTSFELSPNDLYEVIMFDSSTDLKKRHTYRELGLSRYKGKLPGYPLVPIDPSNPLGFIIIDGNTFIEIDGPSYIQVN